MSGVVRRALAAAVALLVVLGTGTAAVGPVSATTPRETIRLVAAEPGPQGRLTTAATATRARTARRDPRLRGMAPMLPACPILPPCTTPRRPGPPRLTRPSAATARAS